jgi:formamidopyrimidine-DNA glycosylase
MPELPEVETVRRGLAPVLEGHRLERVEVRRKDLRVPFSPGFAGRLTGRTITRLSRRAKYLIAETDGPDTLVIHLGMSGRVTVKGKTETRPGRFHHAVTTGSDALAAHDHVVFETDEGVRIVYNDHRRFGLMVLIRNDELHGHPLFRRLGPEPLDDGFTAAILSAALKGKKTPIKSALLDQRVVAGLGNIYVCEALHLARISPQREAASVAGARAARLAPMIRKVLVDAIAAGGSSLRDYAKTDGELGYFQHHFLVYDREGKPCLKPGCRGKIRRVVQAGRSTWFCPVCQR